VAVVAAAAATGANEVEVAETYEGNPEDDSAVDSMAFLKRGKKAPHHYKSHANSKMAYCVHQWY
jgi:hypothetical protein